jgi:hypothetical protein
VVYYSTKNDDHFDDFLVFDAADVDEEEDDDAAGAGAAAAAAASGF